MNRREEYKEILTGVMGSPILRPMFGHYFNIQLASEDFTKVIFKLADDVQKKLDEKFPKEN